MPSQLERKQLPGKSDQLLVQKPTPRLRCSTKRCYLVLAHYAVIDFRTVRG